MDMDKMGSFIIALDYIIRALTNLFEQIALRFGIDFNETTTEAETTTSVVEVEGD